MKGLKSSRFRIKIELLVLFFAVGLFVYCGPEGNFVEGIYPRYADFGPHNETPDLVDVSPNRPADHWLRLVYFFDRKMWRNSFNVEDDLEVSRCIYGATIEDGHTVKKCLADWETISALDAVKKVDCSGENCFTCCWLGGDCNLAVCDPNLIMDGQTVNCGLLAGDYIPITCTFEEGAVQNGSTLEPTAVQNNPTP